MSKPYDTTLKQLLGDFAADWVDWLAPRLGLPVGTAVQPLDVDLSTVTFAADKVFQLQPPAKGLLHIEPQVSWDGALPDRLMLYNVLLHDRYGGPVYTIALLLRREANAKSITGTLTRRFEDGHEYLRFEYSAIRVWELPVEPLIKGNIGAIPLALLTDEAVGHLGELVGRIDDRLRAEKVPDATRSMLLTSGFILEIRKAFFGVTDMKESVSYQMILDEGRQEGRQEGTVIGEKNGRILTRREDLCDILREKFGVVPAELEEQIRNTNDPSRLQLAIRQAVRVSTLAEFEL